MTLHPLEPEADAPAILSRASDVGFSLVQCETDTGQLVWEWRRGDRPRPQFLQRNVAIEWMHNYPGFLSRESSDA